MLTPDAETDSHVHCRHEEADHNGDVSFCHGEVTLGTYYLWQMPES